MTDSKKRNVLEVQSMQHEEETHKFLYDYADNTFDLRNQVNPLDRVYDNKTILTPIQNIIKKRSSLLEATGNFWSRT